MQRSWGLSDLAKKKLRHHHLSVEYSAATAAKTEIFA